EAVEQIALPAVRLLQTLLDHTDDDVVRDELAGVHHLLGGDAQWRTSLHCRTQHVAGRDLRDPESVLDEVGLGALPLTRRSQQDESHACRILRTASRSCGVSTPGGISVSLTATAMRKPCHSTRSCSSASVFSKGETSNLEKLRRNRTR